MKFLIVSTDYPEFLDALYAAQPGLSARSYDEQLRALDDTLFGVSDFYPRNLRALGHQAHEVHFNNAALQRAWAAEHGVRMAGRNALTLSWRRGWIPWLSFDAHRGLYDVLAAQIEHHRPDVLLTHAIAGIDPRFWNRMRGQYRLLAGQIASPLAPDADLRPFDLMLSSLPNFVERFRGASLRAELFRLAFDPVVLERLAQPASAHADARDNVGNIAPDPRVSARDSRDNARDSRDNARDDGERGAAGECAVSFVGSLSPHHADRIGWLEEVCADGAVTVWGPGVEGLRDGSPVRRAYRGAAWGRAMYQILRDSRISLNHHIGLSGPYANNMRLYEATGVGTLLITDAKRNLSEMFEPGREVVVYNSPQECRERIRYYLQHEDERRAIARAGQQRTLREHTYEQRMRQLVSLVEGVTR